jgi:DNA modification methylase
MKNEYILGDAFNELEKLPDASVDLLFTSLPDLSQTPFGETKDVGKYQSLQRTALEEFARVTKDDGFVVTCQTDRKINGEILPNHITYHNIMMYLGFKLKDYKIVVRNSVELKNMYTFNFQHMNIFTKSGTIKRSGDWLRDILVYPAKKIGKQHIWDESFVKMTLTYLSKEGDFVVDPFAGHGIVPYVCKKMNRDYLGVEILPEIYNKNFELFESGNRFIG